MTVPPGAVHRFEAAELLPRAWRPLLDAGPVYTFNAGIIADGSGWILAFRIVAADTRRRIGLLRLDPRFALRPDSAVPFSDLVGFGSRLTASGGQATEWFADPRLYRLGGRLWLEWNSGWHDDNRQFLQEVGDDLRPVGAPRELRWNGGRRTMEKNWLLFGDADDLRVLYSPCPHRVLAAAWSVSGDIECSPLVAQEWAAGAFAAEFGELRGGAPPVRRGGIFQAFCHSVAGRPGEYRYVASCYRFQAHPPYAVVAVPIRPIALPNPSGAVRKLPKLNPAVGDVTYPCGAVDRGDRWVISYGINDEAVGIVELADAEIDATLRTLPTDAEVQQP